ncbi:MAG TPA: sulfotransferase domain-containing protein [Solirubrobacteraceae bacterium]
MRVVNMEKIDRRIRQALPGAAYDSLREMRYAARVLARRNAGRGRLLPDFLIIGSTKCATTSLHGWLGRHPLVAETEKEIHFFNLNYHRRSDWYRCHFPHRRERDQFVAEHGRPFICGEATASYLADYWTPRRAAKLVPNARLIVCLRDPADRSYSQYHYFRKRGSEPLETFEEAIASEEQRLLGEEAREIEDPRFNSWRVFRWGYLRTSRYAEHLERWLEVFAREQFLFLKFDDVVSEPELALERIHRHLGIPHQSHGELPALNAGSYEPMVDGTRGRLREYFKPHNERLHELTGVDFGF